MKTLIVFPLLLLISCEKNENAKENNVIGSWRLVSKENIITSQSVNYPDTLDSSIIIEFNQDSIRLFACNRFLGSGEYRIRENDKLTVDNFTTIEPCSLNGWIETVTDCIIHSVFLSVDKDVLIILTDRNNKFTLKVVKNDLKD